MSREKGQQIWLVIPGVPPSLWSFQVDADEVCIGRSEGCDIKLAHETVSRRHAKIFRGRKIGYILEDLGSSNGTSLNSRPLFPATPKQIEVGDTLRFGNVQTTVLSAAALQAQNLEWAKRSTKQLDMIADLGMTDPDGRTLHNAPLKVLQLLLKGFRNKRIASQLHISEDTVKSHVKAIYRHFDVHSSKELFALMLSRRLEPINSIDETVRMPTAQR